MPLRINRNSVKEKDKDSEETKSVCPMLSALFSDNYDGYDDIAL